MFKYYTMKNNEQQPTNAQQPALRQTDVSDSFTYRDVYVKWSVAHGCYRWSRREWKVGDSVEVTVQKAGSVQSAKQLIDRLYETGAYW
jgi:hypothetical protein